MKTVAFFSLVAMSLPIGVTLLAILIGTSALGVLSAVTIAIIAPFLLYAFVWGATSTALIGMLSERISCRGSRKPVLNKMFATPFRTCSIC